VIHHQEPLPHNVELGYDTVVGPSRGDIIGVDRHIGERTTTHVRMIPHLHSKL